MARIARVMSQQAKYILFFALHLLVSSVLSIQVAAQALSRTHIKNLTVVVADSVTGNPLAGASATLSGGATILRVATGVRGEAHFTDIEPGKYDILISFVGYDNHSSTILLTQNRVLNIRLSPSTYHMGSVVVTASESQGMSTSSVIGRQAMEHLQPSSLGDLLELLPGGHSSEAVFGKPASIRLREVAGKGTSYATSSLGVAFLVDGAPRSVNADMQYVAGDQDNNAVKYNNLNKGVDMRTISTDDIQSVEIVRGIPSVEYGDLTSGLVKIERKKGGHDFSARFKSDLSSNLYYAGKGFEWDEGRTTLNIDLDMLDAHDDPRNKLENYKRLTGSVRVSKRWERAASVISLSSSGDYTGSFDNWKTDPDLYQGKVNEYRSQFNALGWSSRFSLAPRNTSFFRELSANASLAYELDKIERQKQVVAPGFMAVPNSMEAGEHDAGFLPASYLASHTTDGRPFNAFLKVMATFYAGGSRLSHNIKVGGDWMMDKNYGRGQIFDIDRPINVGTVVRPVSYDHIPARHDLSFFAEDLITLHLGDYTINLAGGVRSSMMCNLDSDYRLDGKPYFDPRLNTKIIFPGIGRGQKRLKAELRGGLGVHTKFPTISQLYPQDLYLDFVQLNIYYDRTPELSRINMMTYIVDPTNHSLLPARNTKYEAGLDLSLDGNRLSLTWFMEDMRSGFRNSPQYASYTYKKYPEAAELPPPPFDLSDLPYQTYTALMPVSGTTNGSRTLKRGVEFVFSSKRWETLKTRLTVTGAWFDTSYSNSQYTCEKPPVNLGNEPFPYVGLYGNSDRSRYRAVNTVFMLDTDVERLGLRFSLSLQAMWYTSDKHDPQDAYPQMYMDVAGSTFPYTEASKNDLYLQHLKRSVGGSSSSVPFAACLNMKATKELLRERMRIALFVNNLLDISPDYMRHGYLVRRSATPYFGMELNIML